MTTISRILVPIDFEETSTAALAYATELAWQLGAAVSLVHVYHDPYAAAVYMPDVYGAVSPEVSAGARADLESRLRSMLPDTKGEGRAAVVVGTTAQAIVEHAREQRVDLIVIGTHARRGLAHALLGSVAEQVLRTAPCPVLAVQPPGDARSHAA